MQCVCADGQKGKTNEQTVMLWENTIIQCNFKQTVIYLLIRSINKINV